MSEREVNGGRGRGARGEGPYRSLESNSILTLFLLLPFIVKINDDMKYMHEIYFTYVFGYHGNMTLKVFCGEEVLSASFYPFLVHVKQTNKQTKTTLILKDKSHQQI